jgi:hypothetical protein
MYNTHFTYRAQGRDGASRDLYGGGVGVLGQHQGCGGGGLEKSGEEWRRVEKSGEEWSEKSAHNEKR